MNEHLNVGDVTGPRWAGGTTNPDDAAWHDYVLLSPGAKVSWKDTFMAGRASRDAEVEVLREQLAAAEARAVHAELEWAAADASTVLAEAAKADAWDEGARYVTHDSTYTEMFDIPANPYRSGTEGGSDHE